MFGYLCDNCTSFLHLLVSMLHNLCVIVHRAHDTTFVRKTCFQPGLVEVDKPALLLLLLLLFHKNTMLNFA